MSGRVRVLFANEGDLGGSVLGHVAVEQAMMRMVDGRPDIDATFVRLPSMGRPTSLLVAEAPGLNALDLDLKIARWHAVQAVRMRRLVAPVLRSGAVDVAHVDSHTVSFGLLDLMRRVPTVLSVDATVAQWQQQGLWHTWRPWSRATIAPSVAIERRAFERAYAAVAFSDWSAEGIREVAPTARVEVIHPGVDTERFTPPARREARDRPRLLFVGGRFAEKGGDDLITALEGLLGSEIDLDVVTNADVERRSGVTVHRLGHGDPALVRLFQQADALVLPTHADAVPVVVVEALACGTPVVVSDVAALPALAGDAGVVVAKRRPDLLREAITRLLGDDRRLLEMRHLARLRAERDFSVRVNGERLVSLLREAAAS